MKKTYVFYKGVKEFSSDSDAINYAIGRVVEGGGTAYIAKVSNIGERVREAKRKIKELMTGNKKYSCMVIATFIIPDRIYARDVEEAKMRAEELFDDDSLVYEADNIEIECVEVKDE